jgi:hypothetical protein
MYERTRVLVRHGPRLFHQINLETNEEFHFPARLPGYGNHSQEVHERLTTSPVVDQTDLCFCSTFNHVFQIVDGVVVNIVALDTGLDFAIGCLQKAAISAKNHVSCVAGKAFEVFGAVNDGYVV